MRTTIDPPRAAGRAPSITRRQLLGWGAASGALLGLAGCSGSSAFDSAKSLTFTFWGSGAEKTAVSAVVDAFAKSRRLTGNPLSYPLNYDTKMNTLIAGGSPPDAGYFTEGMTMRLGTQGKLYNVLDNEVFAGFMPTAIHYVSKHRAVSQSCIEAMALWYDADVMAKAGITVPSTAADAWSWDDFISAAEKVTIDSAGRRPSEKGFDAGAVKRYGTTPPNNIRALMGLMKSNGVDVFDEDGRRCALDSRAAIRVLQAINDMIFEHRVAPSAAQIGAIGGSAGLQLASKKVAMTIDGQWQLLDLNDAKKKGLNYDVGVFPDFGHGSYTVTMSGGIGAFTDSNNKSAAVDLLLALADPETCPLYSSGLWMPPQQKYYDDPKLRSVWIDPKTHPEHYGSAVADMAMKNQVALPSFRLKNYSAIDTALGGGLTPMFTKKMDVTDAAKALADRVNSFMQGRYPDSEPA